MLSLGQFNLSPRHGDLQVIFQCPNPECKAFMFGYYNVDLPVPVAGRPGPTKASASLRKIEPPNLQEAKFADDITKISPSFVICYHQANEAKQRGLDQIAGPGFRKAFEFLIKDYAKSKSADPKDHEKIENQLAGNVVKNFIPDPRIQAIAGRTLWIGNDETHYLRKWADKDINDLVALITLTIYWIEMELLSDAYVARMPDPRSKPAP